MKKNTISSLFLHRFSALFYDDSGAVLMLTLGIFLFLFIMVGGVYVTGSHIESKIKLQNAVDASAYSAATIQADALSRMAVVNKAMSWTYVQMCKRQMDYITYRWLKLTIRNFKDDRTNAKNFHAYYPWSIKLYGIPVYSNPEWIDFFVRGSDKCPEGHGNKNNGGGWFCGLGKSKPDKLILNGTEIDLASVESMVAGFEESVIYPLEQELNIADPDPDPASGSASQTAVVPPSGPINGDSNHADNVRQKMQAFDLSRAIEGLDMVYYYKKAKAESDSSLYLGKAPVREDFIDSSQTVAVFDENSYNLAVAKYENTVKFFSNAELMDEPVAEDYYEEDDDEVKKAEGINKYNQDRAVYDAGMAALKKYAQERHNYRGAARSMQEFENESGMSRPVKPDSRASDEEWEKYVDNTNAYMDAYSQWKNGTAVSQGSTSGGNTGNGTGNNGNSGQGANSNTGNNSSGNNSGTKSGDSRESDNWGRPLAQLIEMDKNSIEMMNFALSHINDNMVSSMKDTVEMVLAYNLAPPPPENNGTFDPSAILKDYNYYYKAPVSVNPYDTQNDIGGYFSPVNNTEPYERLFLAMGNKGEKTLRSYFINEQEKNNGSKARGIDQWFIRGGVDENGDTVRFISGENGSGGEGGMGIMRVYKSANCNETGAGLLGGITGSVDRGNHLIALNLNDRITPPVFSYTIYGIDVGKIISENILGPLVQNLLNSIGQLADVAPSAGNVRSQIPYMCREVEDSVALYSEYRWTSAKWFCRWKIKFPHWGLPKFKWTEHFGFPKMFCGGNNMLGDEAKNDPVFGKIAEYVDCILQFLPPYLLPIGTVLPENHGYLDEWNWLTMFTKAVPFKQLMGSHSTSREDYRPCAMMFDYPGLPFIQGHARIYGDDREIFDECYKSAVCRPWLINEKFFSEEGTIVVAAAKRTKNPFAAFFSKETFCDGLFAVFNPSDEKRPAWAISAARAGVKSRKNGAGKRDYDIHFDNGHLNLKKHQDITNKKDRGAEYSVNIGQTPAGCVCHNDNQKLVEANWNLCETDWEPTLIPLRYYANKATSENNKHPVYSNVSFNKSRDSFFDKRMWMQWDGTSNSGQNQDLDLESFSPGGKRGTLNFESLFYNNKIY